MVRGLSRRVPFPLIPTLKAAFRMANRSLSPTPPAAGRHGLCCWPWRRPVEEAVLLGERRFRDRQAAFREFFLTVPFTGFAIGSSLSLRLSEFAHWSSRYVSHSISQSTQMVRVYP